MKTKLATILIKFDTTGLVKMASFKSESKLDFDTNALLRKLNNTPNSSVDELQEYIDSAITEYLSASQIDIIDKEISREECMSLLFMNDSVKEFYCEYFISDSTQVVNN